MIGIQGSQRVAIRRFPGDKRAMTHDTYDRPVSGMPRPDGVPLVLGLAAGYHAGDVRPFLRSLGAVGFAGECVLFVSPTTRGTDEMQRLGARIVPFERPAAMAHVPCNAWRYFLYLDFLRAESARHERILLTDVRDVIFQRDPFALSWENGLHVMLEDARMRVADCAYMVRWTLGHLGRGALAAMADRPISCSGTTFGDRESVLAYLERLTARLLPFAPGPGMAGFDQAVHNYLLHTGGLPGANLHENGRVVLTLGYVEGEPKTDADGAVLAADGRPVPMVHQYDRKPALFRQIRERWG